MGCILTKVCEEDEEERMLAGMDKPKTSLPPPKTTLARTLTSLALLEAAGLKSASTHKPPSPSSEPDTVFYGGGVPGVALDEECLASPTYTGAHPDGHVSMNGKLQWGAHTRAGNDPLRRRKENQDSFCVADCLAEESHATLFSIFDGHGPEGAFVSQFVRNNFHKHVGTRFRELVLAPQRGGRRSSVSSDVISEAFQRAAEDITDQLCKSTLDLSISGTTCCNMLVSDGDVFVANIGDSRAVVAEYGEVEGCYRIRHESKDHKPDTPSERQRIEASNGRVFEWGTYRVWLQDVDMPGLGMSRSLGDAVAKTVGVTNEPDVVYVDRFSRTSDTVTPHPSFAVLASDGVWEFISTEECVAFVADCILVHHMTPQQSCDALVHEAFERWNAEDDAIDDITAIVVFF